MKLKVLILTLSATLASVPAFAIPTSIIVTGQWVTTSADENPFAPGGSQFRFDITPLQSMGGVIPVFWRYQALTAGGSTITLGSAGSLDELILAPSGAVGSVVLNYFDSTGIGGGTFILRPSDGYAEYQFLTLFATASAGIYDFQETPEPGSLALVSVAALAAITIRRGRKRNAQP